MSSADSRVQAGAQLLDETKPDWFERVNVDELDMKKAKYCVLGHVYGDYYDGLRVLGLPIYDRGQSSNLGFIIPGGFWSWFIKSIFGMNPWNTVKKAWKKEIADRQAQAAQPTSKH